MGRRKLPEAEVLRRKQEKEKLRQTKLEDKLIKKTKRQNSIHFYRQVVRTYTKKDGSIVTYVYDKAKYTKSTAGEMFVNDKGKVNKRVVNSYIKALDRTNLSKEKKDLIATKLDELIHTRVKNHKTLTTNGFTAIWASEKPSKNIDPSDERWSKWRRRLYFINQGLSAEQVADELGCTVDEILDDKNWDGNKFINPANNKSYMFKFSYKDDYYSEVI